MENFTIIEAEKFMLTAWANEIFSAQVIHVECHCLHVERTLADPWRVFPRLAFDLAARVAKKS